VKAIAGTGGGGCACGGVFVVVSVATGGVGAAGGVGTGGAVTVVVTVFELHVVITGVPQLGPLHDAVLEIVSPAESVDFAVTW